MFDILPVLGWITIALGIVIARAMRVSDAAREARGTARVSLKWLVAPAILSWVLLALGGGDLWRTHIALFVIQVSSAVYIVPRYRA